MHACARALCVDAWMCAQPACMLVDPLPRCERLRPTHARAARSEVRIRVRLPADPCLNMPLATTAVRACARPGGAVPRQRRGVAPSAITNRGLPHTSVGGVPSGGWRGACCARPGAWAVSATGSAAVRGGAAVDGRCGARECGLLGYGRPGRGGAGKREGTVCRMAQVVEELLYESVVGLSLVRLWHDRTR
eukprot:360373-Chlamydomonas_euryale.AAC.1